jgi:hypothetical protein
VGLVVELGLLGSHLRHLEASDTEAACFQAGYDFANQAALDCIGFGKDKSAFHGVRVA